jgi:hypothetical protein
MHAQAYVLCADVDAAVDTAAVQIAGGRYVLALVAAAYGTTVKLQAMGPNSTWIDINATTYSANQITSGIDLPSGQVRMHITGGTTTDLYATLCRVPY